MLSTEADKPKRYRPLPTGTHGLDPDVVKRDQRKRLQDALVELIAKKGYPGVRIVDLAKLAHVSPPTFYSLYEDKEDLFLSAYDEISARTAKSVLRAYATEDPHDERRLLIAMRAFAEIAAAEPEAVSLFVLGAFGAGTRALERRKRTLDEFESRIIASRDGEGAGTDGDLTVKFILGGIREVTAARLRDGRQSELLAAADELTSWAAAYPRHLPSGLTALTITPPKSSEEATYPASERAQRAEGRLPSGRSDMPRQFIVKSQRERIVDATAAIAAEKGLAAVTIPRIAKRANVSYQTFYDIYASKHDAFLGAQKVGMHQALRITIEAYEAHEGDWPRAIAAGLAALIDFLASEPAHAHLSVVDTFAASPETIAIRSASMEGFAAYFQPGYELAGNLAPSIAAEAITGGIWQVFHHCIENDCLAELPAAVPQLAYMALAPFIGPSEAAKLGREAAQLASA
ncbi:MAG TPA: TetR/AcrR family transcriptional regulator [Solirubrobacteraceae bacterium]|nr:TetR/AcrR family transcriptional regulator [Solirubrobacteraceae bacterium]